jgi:F-type H+-transporting ATPase subunit delta
MLGNEVGNIYSEALFEIAKDQDVVDQVKQEFEVFMELWESVTHFPEFLFAPIIKNENKHSLIRAIFANHFSTIFINFLCLLVDRHRQFFIPNIWRYFLQFYDDYKKQQLVKIYSAVPIPEDVLTVLGEKIKAKIHEDVLLRNKIDPSLIGGIVIKSETELYDLSVARELKNINTYISESKLGDA